MTETETQIPYAEPSDAIKALVDAPPTPIISVSPDATWLLHLHYLALPSIEMVAEPYLKLAGLRIVARYSSLRRLFDFTHIELQSVLGEARRVVARPAGCERIIGVSWSPDSRKVAIGGIVGEGVGLWTYDIEAEAMQRLPVPALNDTLASCFRWLPDSSGLIVALVPLDRGPAPVAPRVPIGPVVKVTADRMAQNRTFQDLLQNGHDEALFEHYMRSQSARVNLDGTWSAIGAPGLLSRLSPSPDGRHLLVEVLQRPFSHDVPYSNFAHRAEVWDLGGAVERTICELGVSDEIPIQGVPVGPRRLSWTPMEDATLVWVEALDGGDPNRKVDHRDKIMRLAAPFAGEPEELQRVKERLSRVQWLDRPGEYLMTEYDRDRRWATTWLCHTDGAADPRVIFDRSIQDAYSDPGSPVDAVRPDGTAVVEVEDGWVWMAGNGATPEGYRPFVDRFNLDTFDSRRVFQSSLEVFSRMVGFGPTVEGAATLLFRRESVTEVSNLFLVVDGAQERQLTFFEDPHPQLTGIKKQLLTYTRADGVPLSGTLYLPPDHKEGERLPLVIWAYPLEYNDGQTAGQVRAAPNTFTRLGGTSPLMFLAQGYAVLNDATMPIVGDPETANDTFVEQIRSSAQAAIDAVVELGVGDRERVAVAGHSYGAFMTANLLAHTDLFKAGIARSGAYNRSLTPFGFQSERRTMWQAREIYVELSPLFHADKIKAPLLLIHGEEDANAGTYPDQSKRLFHAIKGLGGTSRLVLLPFESHGYQARESVLHVLAECFDWLDRYVKHAAPTEARDVPTTEEA